MSALSIVIVLLLASAQATTQEPSLVELARQHGGVNMAASACGFIDGPPSLEKLLRQAEVIVHGTVVEVEGRLTKDEHRVLTDYRLAPIRVLRDPKGILVDSSHPAQFTASGGTVVVEGLTINYAVEHNSVSIQVNVGDEVIFFGKEGADGLMIYPFDVFRVREGVVLPNGGLTDVPSSGMPLSEFLALVNLHP